MSMTDKCAICLEELKSGLGSAVPCGHVFHRSCFEALKESVSPQASRPKCPCCKRKVKRFHKVYLTVSSPSVSIDSTQTDRALCFLTTENMRLQKRIRELKALSNDQSDLLFRILPRYDHIEVRYQRLKHEKRELRKKLNALDEENSELISQWSDVEMQLSHVETERNELEIKLEEADAENRDLHTIWDNLEDRLDRSSRKKKAKRRKLKLGKAKLTISNMKRQEKVLNDKLKESQARVLKMKRRMKRMKKQLKMTTSF